MSASLWPDVLGTIIKPNGLETPYRIGDQCGTVFDEDEEYDGITLTIAVESEDEARAILAIIENASRPDPLSGALNSGDGTYRP